jgi:hypothetical protein
MRTDSLPGSGARERHLFRPARHSRARGGTSLFESYLMFKLNLPLEKILLMTEPPNKLRPVTVVLKVP